MSLTREQVSRMRGPLAVQLLAAMDALTKAQETLEAAREESAGLREEMEDRLSVHRDLIEPCIERRAEQAEAERDRLAAAREAGE